MPEAEQHKWEFRARFRKNAFGWKSQPAMTRIKEAVKEIKKYAKVDSAVAADGAVLFLEKLVPAIEHVDSSSGAIGNTVYGAVLDLTEVISKAELDADVRQALLVRLYAVLINEDMGYLECIGDSWGDLCGSEVVAAKWADEMIERTRTALCSEGTGFYYKGTTACLSSLFKAGQYSTLLELLNCKPGVMWDYLVWGVRALEAQGLIDDAIELTKSASTYTTSGYSVAKECERILIAAGRIKEAYDVYAHSAIDSNTYVGTFRAIAKKYPSMSQDVILRDLIRSTPGDEGKWFAAVKEAGFLDLALELATKKPCEPKTLNRAAKDFEEKDPKFAFGCALASLRWLVQGYGYEISNLDVLSAYFQFKKLGEQLDESEKVQKEIEAMMEGVDRKKNFAVKVLAQFL